VASGPRSSNEKSKVGGPEGVADPVGELAGPVLIYLQVKVLSHVEKKNQSKSAIEAH